MHDLDERTSYAAVDPAHMHLRLAGLPQQCGEAYAAAQDFSLPADYHDASWIVIAAMGGSAVGASFAQAVCTPLAKVPVLTWLNYGLPAYASGPKTLVIASSTSGNTEETLSAFDEAARRGCHTIAMTSGGALAQHARERGTPVFQFSFEHQPREAIGWLSLPLFAMLANLDIIPDPSTDVREAIAVMNEAGQQIGIDSPAVRNPAKRLAGQVMDRLPIIYGAGMLAPVARRWKTMLNENAKTLAVWDEMPELNHNTVMGYEHAEAVWQKSIVIQLRSDFDDPRVSQRFDLTTRLMLEAGINQDTVHARGKSALAQLFSLVQFGDWVSYYAAIMSGIDPTPTGAIQELKLKMSN